MSQPAETLPEDGLPNPQRLWAVITIALAIAMAVLDGAIANVALPTIAVDLHVSPSASIWVVNAYQLVITCLMLPLSSLGDRIGCRRIYQVGLAIFTLASLGCATSHSLIGLSAARIVQGVGAAAVMSVNTALLRYVWPRRMLGKGLGINALTVAVSSAIGPSIAAAILSLASWPWLFAVNVPIGLAAFVIGRFALPATRQSPHRFDLASAALNATTFGLLIVALDGTSHGERPALAAAELLVAIVVGVVLVRRQLRLPAPLLPIDLMRRSMFALAVGTSFCSFVAQMLAYVSLPFLLQDQLGHSQVQTGLLMTPWPLMTALTAPIAGKIADRYPVAILSGLGLAAYAAGLASLAALGSHPDNFDICWRMALAGFGFGLFQSPNNRAMLTAAPVERSGAASGMLGMTRLLGQTIGAALTALVFELVHGYGTTATLALAACFAAGAAVVSSVRLGRRAVVT